MIDHATVSRICSSTRYNCSFATCTGPPFNTPTD